MLPLLRLLRLLLLLLPPPLTSAWGSGPQDDLEPRNYTLLHTLFCQDGEPALGLAEVFEGDPLFSFDFSSGSRRARLPEFESWAGHRGDLSGIAFDSKLCKELLSVMTPCLDGKIPESRGIPAAQVFTLEPLRLGQPNTLVCSISNLFPPEATVSWQHQGLDVGGEGPALLVPTEGLTFQAFAYLNFTPAASDLYACVVTRQGDLFSTIAFWVPQDTLPSDLLENVLCGLAFGLGIVGIFLGIGLLIYYRRPD
ncbi:HLA class II histocompatibility antigen, DM alpha chain [Tachyglossus aculeatus]|uniref:HLA class II histocompatibility antigen, DM alpha chain n=1 Tax=Tachyglossus aculeatus TaxID=9261 RepID=UPI0018F2D8E0|nr:HLA class II histocompatibility antigen, DM alpha chain [Tachyglossus aculeatus]